MTMAYSEEVPGNFDPEATAEMPRITDSDPDTIRIPIGGITN